jgi:Flp pilus assembly protein TadD
LRDAIRLGPTDWQPHYRLANNLAQQGDFSEAAAEYREALRLNPANVKTKLGLAAVLMNLNHTPEALQQVDEALQLEPANRMALELESKIRGK